MRTRTLFGTSALVVGSIALSAAPAATARPAFHDIRESRVRDNGPALAARLAATTDRLEDLADARRGLQGRRGRQYAGTLHRMDEWAGYYLISVEREGFRSPKARQRFQRFLVEYRDACQFLDDVRRPFPRQEVSRLHTTVAQLSGAYGVHVARDDERDRRRN